MTRRFQFSLRRLLLATVWLSLAAAVLANLGHTYSQSPTLAVETFIGMLVCVGGALGTLTGTPAVRHSFYGASAGLVVGVAMVAALAGW